MSEGRLLPTERLLLTGGDARIAADTANAGRPDPQLAALGSSTASRISAEGFAAADRLRQRIVAATGTHGLGPALAYARELERMRDELRELCGLADLPGLDIVFAASGTDLHLIAAQISGGSPSRPTLAVMVDPAETGSGVPAALAGRHFSALAALGESVGVGLSIAGSGALEVATVPLRLAEGDPRAAAVVDAEVESLATEAHASGRRVLLTLVDQSKTGLIAPSVGCVLGLARRLPDTLDVLVDACQFRMAPRTLRAYLDQGFMVALTGSKFLTGPSFAGALLIPAGVSERLRRRPLPDALLAYSCRADWPRDWDAAGSLKDVANFGLLLRWEAALQELRAYRRLSARAIDGFLRAFAQAVDTRLQADPLFSPLPVPGLDRRPLLDASANPDPDWDGVQTIFPFVLHHPETAAGKRPLNRDETAQVYRLLQADLSAAGLPGAVASLRCQLGQPVQCGSRDGIPVSALRLCASARLVIEACAGGEAAVIDRALAALDKTAAIVRSGLASQRTTQ